MCDLNMAKIVDGAWLLAGNPEQIERVRALLAEAEKETPWSERLAIMDWLFSVEELLIKTGDMEP